jgi:hypothetical protein
MNDPSRDDLGREETIFNAAIQLRDSAKRAIYLDLACEGDAALRARIEKLLTSDAGDAFLAQPLAKPVLRDLTVPSSGAPMPGAPTLASLMAAQLTEQLGDTIGRYKLIEKLGEGGCGVVYMAEQEEPVRRKVALKIIKLGMDTRQVVARFEAERQALALMDHPNIAKVLDAGATDASRPYFVMELVGGIKITDYCEQNQLTTRQRLDLFIQVCRAIQHAHQKGVIHRDIKPSNVLVATQDGVADELTKSMAQSVTRRGALKKFGVGLAGMALACFGLANSARAANRCKTNADCSLPQVCNSGACVPVPCESNTDCRVFPLTYRCCYKGFCSYLMHCVRFP